MSKYTVPEVKALVDHTDKYVETLPEGTGRTLENMISVAHLCAISATFNTKVEFPTRAAWSHSVTLRRIGSTANNNENNDQAKAMKEKYKDIKKTPYYVDYWSSIKQIRDVDMEKVNALIKAFNHATNTPMIAPINTTTQAIAPLIIEEEEKVDSDDDLGLGEFDFDEDMIDTLLKEDQGVQEQASIEVAHNGIVFDDISFDMLDIDVEMT